MPDQKRGRPSEELRFRSPFISYGSSDAGRATSGRGNAQFRTMKSEGARPSRRHGYQDILPLL